MAKTHLGEMDGVRETIQKPASLPSGDAFIPKCGWACANMGHLSMCGAWWERVILSLNWFNPFDWFCGLVHFPQESKKIFFNILLKTTTFFSIVLMIWVSKEPSLSGILIHTPVSTRADQSGSEWRHDWIFLSIGKNTVLFLGWKKGFKYLATWCKELTGWKRPWCWERLRARGEGGDRGWDAGWHHWLNGCVFEQTPGDSEG